MPFAVDWFISGKVLLFNFFDDVTLEDVRQSTLAGQEHTRTQGEVPVHLLVDARRVKTVPYNIAALISAMRHHPSPDQLGWVLVIAQDNTMLRFIAAALSQVPFIHLDFRLFKDMPSAILFLQEEDARLRKPVETGPPPS